MPIEIPEGATDLVLWTMIVSFFAPIVLDLILQSTWKKSTQSIVAFAVAAVIGIATAYFSGLFNGVGIVTAILLAFVVSANAYKSFWKNVAPGLKERTSIESGKFGSDAEFDGDFSA